MFFTTIYTSGKIYLIRIVLVEGFKFRNATNSSEYEVAVVTLESGPYSRPSEYVPTQPKQL